MRTQNREKKDINNSDSYSKSHGMLLLKLARSSIASKLGITSDLPEPSMIMKELEDKIFDKNVGTFVTLHINKKLRGCIGTLESTESIKEGVRKNAISAAFDDPRFPALTADEFNNIDLEISILSKPVNLSYTDANDLLSKLTPEVDGVIITKGRYRATFLPQVWQQLSDKKLFLSNLCHKAGLRDDEWKKGNLEVMTYTVQYFEE